MQCNVFTPPTDRLGRDKPVPGSYPTKKFEELRALFGEKGANVENRNMAEEHVILSTIIGA